MHLPIHQQAVGGDHCPDVVFVLLNNPGGLRGPGIGFDDDVEDLVGVTVGGWHTAGAAAWTFG